MSRYVSIEATLQRGLTGIIAFPSSINFQANNALTIYTSFQHQSTRSFHCVKSAMRLYIYRGLDSERVPYDATHVIVDSSVTIIKDSTISTCVHLVSVIMGDSVKRIEECAFANCDALRFIRLSKKLEYIGQCAFWDCHALEALFLPSTVKSIEYEAFKWCNSLRLLVLPNDIDLSNVGNEIFQYTDIHQFAVNAGMTYELDERDQNGLPSSRQMNEWLFHHMDEAPFHKLCYNSSITTRHINYYLLENGTDAALAFEPYYEMTPLHMLSMNPHAPADTIAALLDVNMEAAFLVDNQGKVPLDYARDYNGDGLVAMVNGLCNHRHSA